MKRNLFRIGKWLAIVLACLPVAVALFIFAGGWYLKTDHAHQLIQAQVNKIIPGFISYEPAIINFSKGLIRLKSLKISDANAQSIAGAQEIKLEVHLVDLLKGQLTIQALFIDHPWVELKKDRQGRLNLVAAFAGQPPDIEEKKGPSDQTSFTGLPSRKIVIHHFQINQGKFTYAAVDHAVDFTLDNIQIKAEADLLNQIVSIALSTGKGRLQTPYAVGLQRMEVKAGLTRTSLLQLHIKLDTNFNEILLQGRVDDLFHNPRGAIQVQSLVRLKELAESFKITIPMEGEIRSQVKLSGLLDNPKVEMAAQCDGGMIAGHSFEKLTLNSTLKNKQLKINQLAFSGLDGEIKLSSGVNLSDAFRRGFLKPPTKLDKINYQGTVQIDKIKIGALFGNHNAIDGLLSLKGTVGGTLKNPTADLAIQAEQLDYDRFEFGKADLRLTFKEGRLFLEPSKITNKTAVIHLAGQAQLLDPHTFAVLKDPVCDLRIQCDSLRVEDFMQGAQGKLAFNGHVYGLWQDPAATLMLNGQRLHFKQQVIEQVHLSGNLANRRFIIDSLVLKLADKEKIEGRAELNFDQTFAIHVSTQGISLNRINALKDYSDISGKVKFVVTGQGTLKNPLINAHLKLQDIEFKQHPLDDVDVDLRLADRVLHLQSQQPIAVSADLNLETSIFQGEAGLNHMALAPVFQILKLPELKGRIEGRIQVRGSLNQVENLHARINLNQFLLQHNDINIIETSNFNIIYENGKLQIPKAAFIFADKGRVILWGQMLAKKDVALNIKGDIPLTVLQHIAPDMPPISGNVRLKGSVSGSIKDPRIQAQVSLENAGMTLPELNQKLHDVHSTIDITADKIVVSNLEGMLDTGRFNLHARLDLDHFRPQRIDARINTLNLPILLPDMLDLKINSTVKIKGTVDQTKMEGEINILEGRYYKDVDLSLVQLLTPNDRAVASPPRNYTLPFVKHMALEIALRERNSFIVDNNLADMEVRPDLMIGGTLSKPVIKGRAAIVAGMLIYKKKEFEIKKGYIDFINPYKIEPQIDIESTVAIRRWQITLLLKGTPEALSLTFKSMPQEKEEDILSILLFGKTTGELIAGEGGKKETTSQMIASLIASTFGEDIKEQTGIDILEVETQDQNQQNNNQIKVTVGKKVTKRLTLKYALKSIDGETIQEAISEYQLLEHFSMRTSRDTAGHTGANLIYRINFR